MDSAPLTIFSAPKAFQGHFGVIQQNAIRSWLSLRPKPTIILFCNEEGAVDVLRGLDVQLVSDVATNSFGTPLVSDMFRQADSRATSDVVAFVSADVILTQRTQQAAHLALSWSKRFLLVAQRHDVDVSDLLEFGEGWQERWAPRAIAGGKLHPPGGIDLFMYPRSQYSHMPPFAIGRTAYDNWMLWNTMASGIPLIDATQFVTLIHQNHDYSHAGNVDVWEGEEARANRAWVKHWTNYYTITHADWAMGADGRIARTTAWRYRMSRPRQMLAYAMRGTRRYRKRLRSTLQRALGQRA